jgi:hypothetical protein
MFFDYPQIFELIFPKISYSFPYLKIRKCLKMN